MGHTKKEIIVEAKVLYELQRGSYEELLQLLDQAVVEHQELFGNGDAVLFATYQSHVMVLNEEGIFFKVPFKQTDGVVKFGIPETVTVEVLSESQMVSNGVNSFLGGGSMISTLRGIVGLQRESMSSLDKVEADLAVIFSGGQIWRKHLSENWQKIGSFAWDVALGSLKMETYPLFFDVLEGKDFSDDMRKNVTKSLVDLEGRLGTMLVSTETAFEKYQAETNGMRDEEEDSMLSQFEAFAGDYVDHLKKITKYVSSTIRESKNNCIACGAFVHDEIAKRYKELELGSRFIRKVSAKIQQQ